MSKVGYKKTKEKDYRIWCKIDGEITSKCTKAKDKANAIRNLLTVYPEAEVGLVTLVGKEAEEVK